MADTLHARLVAALEAQLAPTKLELIDDSAAHAGHAGARDGAHFELHIVSPRFAGLSRVARHRLVYDAVRPWMAEASTPSPSMPVPPTKPEFAESRRVSRGLPGGRSPSCPSVRFRFIGSQTCSLASAYWNSLRNFPFS